MSPKPSETMTEQPEFLHSDAVGSNERLDLTASDGIERNEHLSLSEAAEEDIDGRYVRSFDSLEEDRRHTGVDELRDVLKAETGYSTYAEYLEIYSAKSLYVKDVLKSLTPPGRGYIVNGRERCSLPVCQFTILDVVNDGKSRPQVVPRCNSISATSTVRSLRQPSSNVGVQILLWNAHNYLDQDVVNALGLGLGIDPRFFGALCGEKKRHLDPKHVQIGEAVATVVRHYDPHNSDAVPIVLIARCEWNSTLGNTVEEEIGGVFPFQYPVVETNQVYISPSSGGRKGSDPAKYAHPNYARLLKWCLERTEEPAVGVTSLELQSLIPLFYLDIIRIRDCCKHLRHSYSELQEGLPVRGRKRREEFIYDLPNNRLRLRTMVEDSKDALDHFLTYTPCQTSAELLLTRTWMKAEEDLQRTHQEAARLEAQIRDYLQLQVGDLALQESKKSIELSNRQIEEGKRVKMFTILAFVYIPLNLTTSIFGMNLSELNGSGKKLWVFLTPAMVALLITGASWYLIEEINNYMRWKKRNSRTRTKFTTGVRLGMLAFLWKNGYQNWMWKSGAWWHILTDSNSRPRQPFGATHSACEYVWQITGGIPHEGSEAITADADYEWGPRRRKVFWRRLTNIRGRSTDPPRVRV